MIRVLFVSLHDVLKHAGKTITMPNKLFLFFVVVNVEEWLADMGDINAELQRSNSTSSLPTEGGATSAMTSDYDSEDYGDGPSDSPVPSDQPQSSSQDEEERPDSAEIDKDWGDCQKG